MVAVLTVHLVKLRGFKEGALSSPIYFCIFSNKFECFDENLISFVISATKSRSFLIDLMVSVISCKLKLIQCPRQCTLMAAFLSSKICVARASLVALHHAGTIIGLTMTEINSSAHLVRTSLKASYRMLLNTDGTSTKPSGSSDIS